MAVQWYPGHMHKARKKIKETIPQIDVVIEVLDARIPYSSENPAIAELREGRPCIKLLNKADLADPEITKTWIKHFEQEAGVRALALVAERKNQTQQLPQQIQAMCRKMLPERNLEKKPARVMILGIPNVGKSTLMNGLAGRVLAKVGNEPAVTKAQQKIILASGIQLSDTPGILWPRMDDKNTGYRLAVTGAIKSTAIDYEDVALYAAEFLLRSYPDALMARYKFTQLPIDDVDLLENVGRLRGGLRSGGTIDMHKASEVLLQDLRGGTLGPISLEWPELIAAQQINNEES